MQATDIDKLLKWISLPQDPSNKQQAGLAGGLRKAFEKMPDEVGTLVLRHGSALFAQVDDPDPLRRGAKLRGMCQSIETNDRFGDSPANRALFLSRWTRLFGAADPFDKALPNANLMREMVTEIFDSGQSLSAEMKAYCKTAGAAANVYGFRAAMQSAGKPTMMVYNVIHFMHQNGLDSSKLTAQNIVNVMAMAIKVPPHQVFAGIPAWGAGNHGDVEENKRMHFRKHVLDAHPVEQLPWLDECNLWWNRLKISLTRKQVQTLAPAFLPRVTARFPASDDEPMSKDKAAGIVDDARKAGGWPDALIDHLYGQYGAAYVDGAIAMSRGMQHAIVHTLADKPYAVFLKGIQGVYFIGGRIENGEITISTCFAPRPGVNLETLNADKKLWDVTTT